MNSVAANIFKNPDKQYLNIMDNLYNTLSKEVAVEIEAFVEKKTQEKSDQIWNIISPRYDSLNELYNQMSDQDSREKRNENYKKYFKLIHPKNLTADLKCALKFKNIANDYYEFIEKMSTGELGSIFFRYKFQENVFTFFTNGLLSELDELVKKLEEHNKQIAQHFNLMKNIKKTGKARSATKIAASLLGSIISPIPFTGSIAGKLVGSLIQGDIEKSIQDSINLVEISWNEYTEKLEVFLQNFEEQYKHILLALYGGTISQVNKYFQTSYFEIQDLNLLDYKYLLGLMEKKKIEVTDWVLQSTHNIENLLANNEVKKALLVSERLYDFVEKNPIISRTTVNDRYSILYLANLYKFAAKGKRAMQIKEHNEQDFIIYIGQLYGQMNILVYDKDIPDVKVPTQTELLMYYIHHCLKHHNNSGLQIVLDYYHKNLHRIGETGGGYAGEYLLENDEEQIYIFLTLCEFADDVLSIDHEFTGNMQDIRLSPKVLRKLKEQYKSISKKDKFYKYLRLGIYLYTISYVIGPVNAFIKKHKKSSILTFVVVIALLGLYFQRDTLGLTYHPTRSVESNEKSKDEVRQLKLTVERANIRKEPKIDSTIVITIQNNTLLTFANYKKRDSAGRTWYKVKDTQKNVGWISGSLVKWVKK